MLYAEPTLSGVGTIAGVCRGILQTRRPRARKYPCWEFGNRPPNAYSINTDEPARREMRYGGGRNTSEHVGLAGKRNVTTLRARLGANYFESAIVASVLLLSGSGEIRFYPPLSHFWSSIRPSHRPSFPPIPIRPGFGVWARLAFRSPPLSPPHLT